MRNKWVSQCEVVNVEKSPNRESENNPNILNTMTRPASPNRSNKASPKKSPSRCSKNMSLKEGRKGK